jgi:hypothetical protein
MELTTLPDTLSDTYVSLHPEMKDTLRHISGIVLDENEKPVVDAWISISGNAGSPTDSTGRFSFWAPRSATSLRAECTGYTGYKRQTSDFLTQLSSFTWRIEQRLNL